MSMPVRCFTCNKVIGQYEQKFQEMIKEGREMNEILNRFNLTRYCCRRMFLGYVDIYDKLLLFPKQLKINFEQKK